MMSSRPASSAECTKDIALARQSILKTLLMLCCHSSTKQPAGKDHALPSLSLEEGNNETFFAMARSL